VCMSTGDSESRLKYTVSVAYDLDHSVYTHRQGMPLLSESTSRRHQAVIDAPLRSYSRRHMVHWQAIRINRRQEHVATI
jgi:hypothetical protein